MLPGYRYGWYRTFRQYVKVAPPSGDPLPRTRSMTFCQLSGTAFGRVVENGGRHASLSCVPVSCGLIMLAVSPLHESVEAPLSAFSE